MTGEPQELDPLDAVRHLESIFFSGGEYSHELVVGKVVTAALLCGVQDVDVRKVDGWFLVESTQDWLVEGGVDVSGFAFTRIQSFAAGGVNSMRPEVLLSAFATHVVTITAAGLSIWKGDDHLFPAGGGIEHGRLLGFR